MLSKKFNTRDSLKDQRYSLGVNNNHNTMKRIHLIIFAICAISLVAILVIKKDLKSSSLSNNETTVHVASLPNTQGLPVYLAQEKGYFKEAGLEVTIDRFETPAQIIDAVIQGRAQFTHPGGAMGIAAIANSKNPGKLLVYASAGENEGTSGQNDALLVSEKSSITSVEDLKGKKLGIMAGTVQWQTIAKELLASHNLTYNGDVAIVEVPLAQLPQVLASGQVDAVLAVEPVPTVIVSKNIGKVLVPFVGSQYVANPFFAGAGLMNADFARENPATTKAFINSVDRAIDDINKDPEGSRQYLLGYTQLNEEMIKQVPLPYIKLVRDFDSADRLGLEKFLGIFPKWNVVSQPLSLDNFLMK